MSDAKSKALLSRHNKQNCSLTLWTGFQCQKWTLCRLDPHLFSADSAPCQLESESDAKNFFLHKLWNHYLRGDETEIWREQWDKSWIAVDCSQRTRLKRAAACWWISIKFQCSFGCRTTAVKERRLKHDDSDIPDSQGSSEWRFNHSFVFIRINWGVGSAGSCNVTWNGRASWAARCNQIENKPPPHSKIGG